MLSEQLICIFTPNMRPLIYLSARVRACVRNNISIPILELVVSPTKKKRFLFVIKPCICGNKQIHFIKTFISTFTQMISTKIIVIYFRTTLNRLISNSSLRQLYATIIDGCLQPLPLTASNTPSFPALYIVVHKFSIHHYLIHDLPRCSLGFTRLIAQQVSNWTPTKNHRFSDNLVK